MKEKVVQPIQSFAQSLTEPPNPSGPVYPKIHIATAFVQASSTLLDHLFFKGRLTQTSLEWRARSERFVEQHPTLRTALNVASNLADFGAGLVSQVLDDFSFGLYGRLTGIEWANGSNAFQTGRESGRVISTVWGMIETATGLGLAASSVKLMPPTAGVTAACGALSGGSCLVLGGAALAVETAGVAVGGALAGHGIALQMRNAGNPVEKADDQTLRYGSNTGNTGRNSQILRDNMIQAGIYPPDNGQWAAHHIVASTSQNEWAVASRRLLEKFGIDINAAENGVWVSSSVNSHLNNGKYMEAVYQALRKAQTREDAIRILQRIAEQIRLRGTYP